LALTAVVLALTQGLYYAATRKPLPWEFVIVIAVGCLAADWLQWWRARKSV
jgi:hypothetical protein